MHQRATQLIRYICTFDGGAQGILLVVLGGPDQLNQILPSFPLNMATGPGYGLPGLSMSGGMLGSSPAVAPLMGGMPGMCGAGRHLEILLPDQPSGERANERTNI
eukprot:4058085-Amphidinium_carterae.1